MTAPTPSQTRPLEVPALAGRRTLATTIAWVTAFVTLQAIGAHIRIPVPGSPVPLTMQTFFVLLSGACLGARTGAVTQGAYLSLGACGLPMFTGGAGFLYVFGPTGGYLFGFVMAAYAVGRLVRAGAGKSFGATFIAMLFASYVVIGMGSLYLGLFYGGDFLRGFLHGGAIFAVADLAKVAAAAAAFHGIARFARRR